MLTVFKGTENLSQALENYLTDSKTLSFATGDFLYVGYRKPFSDIYLELKPLAIVANSLSVDYFDGSWTSLNFHDLTNSLNRSGFIRWDKTLVEDWQKSVVQGQELYWIRLYVTNAVTNLEVKGINLVFADDQDLREGYPDVMEYLPEGSVSFIAYHQEARNYILTHLRNKGKTIQQQNKYKLLDQFDLHNFDEIRQAAKYLALSNIFANESDSVDDKWKQKSDGFFRKYSEAINLNFLSIDENDNGKVENNESNAVQYIRVMRL
jgi:hypothetical protein